MGGLGIIMVLFGIPYLVIKFGLKSKHKLNGRKNR
jgi:hypothetical protein